MPPELDPLRELDLNEALELLQPAILFAIGVAIYAVLIFNLYRFMSRKNIFNLDLSRFEERSRPVFRKTVHLVLYVAKYLLIFPLFAFFWFGVLVVMVAFLSRTREVEDLLLIAMAVLTAVRVTSYYTEDLSRDIAKMLPFALLGIFLIDLRYFDVSTSTELLNRAGSEWKSIFYYWVFVVILELILRVTEPYLKGIYNSFRRPSKRRRRDRSGSKPSEDVEQETGDGTVEAQSVPAAQEAD